MADVSVKVSADSTGVSTGLAKAQEAVTAFKETASESINEVGGELTKAFAAGAVIEGVKSLAEEFDRVQKLSERFGESAETIQRVGQAAKLSGSDIETVAKAMTHVTDNGVQAAQGNDKMAEAFNVLGINAKDFVDLPLEDKLLKLSQGYEDGKSNAEKMNVVMQLLGKSGADLIPMLRQGSDSLKNTFDNATVASNETVRSITEATETLEHSFDTLKAWGAEVLGWLIQRVEALGYGFAAITAYIENLSHGLKAAKQAYDDVLQAQADLQTVKEQAAQDELDSARKSPTGDDDAKADAHEAKETERKLGELKEENAKKEHENYLNSHSLLEDEKKLKSEIAEQNKAIAEAHGNGDQLGEAKAKNRQLDLQGELDENLRKQKEAKDKAAEEDKKRNEAIAKHKQELEIYAERRKVDGAEEKLRKLQEAGSRSVSVDSLRAIGGGLAGVNYRNITGDQALNKEQVDLQKQTVEQLKQVVKKLEDKAHNFDSDGSFTL